MNFEEHAAKSLILVPAGSPGAARHALHLCRRSGDGGGEYRSLRDQGAGAGRASAARPAASSSPTRRTKPREAAADPRHAHRRLHGRAAAGRGAGRDRARILRRRAARYRRAQAADPVLDRRRHGHRGGRGGETGAIRRLLVDIDGEPRRRTSPACSRASTSARPKRRSPHPRPPLRGLPRSATPS